MGCDHIQGYLISKPLPATEAAHFVMNRPDLRDFYQLREASTAGKSETGDKQEQHIPVLRTPFLSFAHTV